MSAHRHALLHIANQVRAAEQEWIDRSEWPSVGSETLTEFFLEDPITYHSFNWFATTLTSYLRIISLIDQIQKHAWSLEDLLAHAAVLTPHCTDYVQSAVPAVLQWRNKVAAHPAATAPLTGRKQDALGTLLQSCVYPVCRTAGYFEVGRVKWRVGGINAVVSPWSVTATYERLTPRFWPEASIPALRHRPGSEPSNELGTHLQSVLMAK